MNFRNFLNAVKQNNTKEVKKYLNDKNFNPSQLNSIAIESAIESDSFDTFMLLIDDKRLNPSERDNNSLFFAIKSDNPKYFQILIKNKNIIDNLTIEWVENNFSYFDNKNDIKNKLLDILNIKNF